MLRKKAISLWQALIFSKVNFDHGLAQVHLAKGFPTNTQSFKGDPPLLKAAQYLYFIFIDAFLRKRTLQLNVHPPPLSELAHESLAVALHKTV